MDPLGTIVETQEAMPSPADLLRRPRAVARLLPRTLRARLAILGFLGMYSPAVLLFGVISATAEEVRTDARGSTTQVTSRGPSEPAVWTLIGLAPIAAGAAWGVAGRAVRPIEGVRAVADEIQGSDLSRRLGLAKGPAEITALAASFDAMLDRLQDAAAAQRRLVEEANHDLRTPVAVLRTNADVLLQHPRPTLEVYREGLERSGRIARQLNATVEGLLVSARGHARSLDRQPADLTALAAEVVDEARLLATERKVAVDLAAPARAPCEVDPPTVRRAIANLVDNAVRHAPRGTTVEVEVRSSADAATVSVTDRGEGVPSAEQEQVFDRAYRGAGQTSGTAGLGLAIVRQVALAHGGSVSLVSPTSNGDGCTFELRLPVGRPGGGSDDGRSA